MMYQNIKKLIKYFSQILLYYDCTTCRISCSYFIKTTYLSKNCCMNIN